MNSKHLRLFILAILILFISHECRANPFPWHISVDSATPAPSSQVEKRIRLEYESVRVGEEKVRGEYVFKNLSNKSVSIELGFPIHHTNGEESRIDIRGTSVLIDNKAIEYELIEGLGETNVKFNSKWVDSLMSVVKFKITFKGLEKKRLVIHYPTSIGEQAGQFGGDRWFNYIVSTGALWRGKIKKAEFSICNRALVNIIKWQGRKEQEFWTTRGMAKVSSQSIVNPSGWKFNRQSQCYHRKFQNWSPTEKENIYIESKKTFTAIVVVFNVTLTFIDTLKTKLIPNPGRIKKLMSDETDEFNCSKRILVKTMMDSISMQQGVSLKKSRSILYDMLSKFDLNPYLKEGKVFALPVDELSLSYKLMLNLELWKIIVSVLENDELFSKYSSKDNTCNNGTDWVAQLDKFTACKICGKCYKHGEKHPKFDCLECNANLSVDSWSLRVKPDQYRLLSKKYDTLDIASGKNFKCPSP